MQGYQCVTCENPLSFYPHMTYTMQCHVGEMTIVGVRPNVWNRSYGMMGTLQGSLSFCPIGQAWYTQNELARGLTVLIFGRSATVNPGLRRILFLLLTCLFPLQSKITLYIDPGHILQRQW